MYKHVKVFSLVLATVTFVILGTANVHAVEYQTTCWADEAGTNGGPGDWVFGPTQGTVESAVCGLINACGANNCEASITCMSIHGGSYSYSYHSTSFPPSSCAPLQE